VAIEAAAPSSPRRRRAWWIGGGVAAVVVAGGAVAVGAALGGGGARPDEAVPADALVFAQLDLDPSLAEKVDLFRFLRQFDALADTVPDTDDADPREAALEGLLAERDIDWDADVAPWLGQRFGVAVLPGTADGDEPVPVAVLQVSDVAAAETGLAELVADEDVAVRVVDAGWAYVAEATPESTATLDELAAGDWEPLAAHEPYRAVVDQVPAGVVRAYVDVAATQEAAAAAGATAGPVPWGDQQLAVGLDVTPSSVALVAVTRSTTPPDFPVADAEGALAIATLPDDTLAALEVRGAGAAILRSWDGLLTALGTAGGDAEGVAAEIDAVEEQLGLVLPDDLAVALGDVLVVAAQRGDDGPAVTYRVQTDPAAAEDLLARLDAGIVASGGEPLGLATRVEGDVVTVALDGAAIADTGGAVLGDDPRLAAALPALDGAFVAGWVDADAVAETLDEQGTLPSDPAAAQAIEQLEAVGWTVRAVDERTARLELRVTTAAPAPAPAG
jgi:hypothetical protein